MIQAFLREFIHNIHSAQLKYVVGRAILLLCLILIMYQNFQHEHSDPIPGSYPIHSRPESFHQLFQEVVCI